MRYRTKSIFRTTSIIYSYTRKLIDKSTKEIYDHPIFLQYLFIMSFHFFAIISNVLLLPRKYLVRLVAFNATDPGTC